MAHAYLSLFTGVGGLDLGFSAAIEFLTRDSFGVGEAPDCHGCVEWEAYAAATLLARMEDQALEPAPVWCGDIRKLDGRPMRDQVDWVIGGFPCQDISVAGKGDGIQGKSEEGEGNRSGLWFEFARLIGEIRPKGAFIENVAALRLPGRGFDHVLGELAALGYDAEWMHLRAADVGAPHQRDRIFILAWDPGKSRGLFERRGHSGQREADTRRRGASMAHAVDGPGGAQQRREPEELAAVARPGGASMAAAASRGQRIGGQSSLFGGQFDGGGASSRMGDAERTQPGPGGAAEEEEGQRRGRHTNAGIQLDDAAGTRPQISGIAEDDDRALRHDFPAPFPPGPSDRSAWLDILGRWPHLAPATQPGFCVSFDELALVVDAARADQLRCGGNGVVPLQASVAFVLLARRAGLWVVDS